MSIRMSAAQFGSSGPLTISPRLNVASTPCRRMSSSTASSARRLPWISEMIATLTAWASRVSLWRPERRRVPARSAAISSPCACTSSRSASKSSRLTRSMSAMNRCACDLTMVSTSRRTPSATPAASFIIRPTLSKILLLWVMAHLRLRRFLCQAASNYLGSARLDQSRQPGLHGPQPNPAGAARCPFPISTRSPSPSARSRCAGTRWPISAGVFLGAWYATSAAARKSLWANSSPPFEPAAIWDFAFWAVIGIVLGGRIGYVLFYNLPYFSTHPGEIIALWDGGMSFHGGLIGIIIAMALFTRSKGGNILSSLDLLGAIGTIGIFLGRIANFINGELYGAPTSLPWAVVFPTAGDLPRHPSQLYEAAARGRAAVPRSPGGRRTLFLALETARPRRRHLRHRLRAEPHPRRVRAPARCPARLSARHRLDDHGHGAEPAGAARRGCARRLRPGAAP